MARSLGFIAGSGALHLCFHLQPLEQENADEEPQPTPDLAEQIEYPTPI
jgi:hypothetical protein